MPIINLKGQPVSFNVRTSKRAKHISLRYSVVAGLEVVYPPGLKQPPPEPLLVERSDWILSAIDRLKRAHANRPRREYSEGEAFYFRGSCYRLKLTRDPSRSRIVAWLSDASLELALPDSGSVSGRASIREAVLAFYRRQAQEYLPLRTRQLADFHGFEYETLRIKNQKTRWGSCSAKRNINLNLRLMMAPDGAIDYVIIHELCHLRELSHNPAFWALVAARCPDFRHWKAWFKQHGPSLIL